MYRKICPDCKLSSFSPTEDLGWSCLYCGKDLTALKVDPIKECEIFNVRPGGLYCALCASELVRHRDDLLVCEACFHGYKEHSESFKTSSEEKKTEGRRRAVKHKFQGQIISAQPRIRLYRSFDERSHQYMGYALTIQGIMDGNEGEYKIGIGKAAQANNQFRVGDKISGSCLPVNDRRLEPVDFYKVSGLKLLQRSQLKEQSPPPWLITPPPLDTYRQRGHRRLAAQTYRRKCSTCTWGCLMPVEITEDNWKPDRKTYRTETFCYGPLSCPSYKSGPTRKVRGRRGEIFEEEDWVDEQDFGHREPDE